MNDNHHDVRDESRPPIVSFANKWRFVIACWICVMLAASLFSATLVQGQHAEADSSASRFSDEVIPLADIPKRPRPILELGEPFLGTGTLAQGFRLPTGAVWQPALMAFGTIRLAAQGISDNVSDTNLAEGAARFDLFGNLYLTPSERIVIGFRPLDQDGRFTRFTLHSDPDLAEDDFVEELNFGIRTLFFEGDFGELFPNLDRNDSRGLDIGLSIGRQPMSFQDGLLIDEDAIDAIGLTKANNKWFGAVNTRISLVYGWGDVNRPLGARNPGDKSATLFGIFTETDTPKQTIEVDVIYIDADDLTGSGVYGGLSSIRRIGSYSNTFRVVASFPVGDETLYNSQGVLIHNQLGWTPHHSINYTYVSSFVGINQFRSAARGPSAGGPLAQTGILFAAVGLGRYGAALGNNADKAVGGAIGHQMFFAHTRKQLVLEIGGRYTYDSDFTQINAAAGGARYQMAFGRRGIVVIDAFSSYDFEASKTRFGGRFEVLLKL